MIPKTGSISHNIRLDDPWLTHSKTTQKSVKRHFGLKIFFACGALKGASPRGPCLTAQNRLPWASPSYPSPQTPRHYPGPKIILFSGLAVIAGVSANKSIDRITESTAMWRCPK